MPRVQLNDGRVALRDGRIVLASAGDPCCCGPSAAEGYYAATPCSNVCDLSIAPPVLFVPVSRVPTNGGAVFQTLAGCYELDFSVLYWDCVFQGPPPPFGVGTPPYLCAPLDFYRAGRRYPASGPPLGGYGSCAACSAALYGNNGCPEDDWVVRLPECPGCEEMAFLPPLPGPVDQRQRPIYLPWADVRQALADLLAFGDGCLSALAEAPSGRKVCYSIDVRQTPLDGVRPSPPAGFPLSSIVAYPSSCCACHAALSSVGSYECLTASADGIPGQPGFGTLLGRPRCTPGVRPDWSLAYRCPPQTPIGKPCCCPGTPCHRRLRIRAKRVDTRISTGETTVQAWAGWAPGLVRNWVLRPGFGVWELLTTFSYIEHPACDPMTLFQLLGRAGACGDEGFEVTRAEGNCWRAAYAEERTDTASDLRTTIEYYAAFDVRGDAFPFLPELDGVPSAQQSTEGLLGVPVLPPRAGESQCEGIPLLEVVDMDGDGGTTDDVVVIDGGVVDDRVAVSWRVCQDGCSGDQAAFPEPGEFGIGGRPGGLRIAGGSGGGGGCGGCGGEGGL